MMAHKDERGVVVCGLPRRTRSRSLPLLAGVSAALLAALLPVAAQASMFKGETLDKVADVLAIVVLIIVPVVGITAFWLVHILPEKIAEKRHHPQAQAIQTLCLLSLVFGGLLWPIAWLWAYTKPVLYRMAYGTDKAEGHGGESHTEGHEAATEAPAAAAVAGAPPVSAATATAPTSTPVVAPAATEASASAQLLGLRDELLSMQLLAMQQRIERLAANLGGAKADGKGTV